MSSCQNCQMLLLALKTEIDDLQQRKNTLLDSNDNLMYLLNTQRQSHQQEAIWKERYEEQKQLNRILQSKIKQHRMQSYLQTAQKRSSVDQPFIRPFETKFSYQENSQFKQSKKISQIIKALGKEKTKQNHYSSQCSKRQSVRKQIILRIVDDRMNRQF